jgi:hypothetical protein
VGGSPLNRQDAKDVMFQQTLRELVRAHAAEKANVGCVQCERCLRCTECTFCRESTGLVRCHYCVELESSVDCTHCRTSRQLLRCNHCSGSERCAGSAYLSFCLSGVEFHLLNQRLDRASFFRATAELSHQLGSLSLEALLGR